jgi:hypothetical protein
MIAEIDADFVNTVYGSQGVIHGGYTTGATHAEYRQPKFAPVLMSLF